MYLARSRGWGKKEISAPLSRLCTLFRRISDSRFTWIHDFEENLTESVGPVPFSAQYLICRHVRTDELIRVICGFNLLIRLLDKKELYINFNYELQNLETII